MIASMPQVICPARCQAAIGNVPPLPRRTDARVQEAAGPEGDLCQTRQRASLPDQ
jgi:hypothetical protein